MSGLSLMILYTLRLHDSYPLLLSLLQSLVRAVFIYWILSPPLAKEFDIQDHVQFGSLF